MRNILKTVGLATVVTGVAQCGMPKFSKSPEHQKDRVTVEYSRSHKEVNRICEQQNMKLGRCISEYPELSVRLGKTFVSNIQGLRKGFVPDDWEIGPNTDYQDAYNKFSDDGLYLRPFLTNGGEKIEMIVFGENQIRVRYDKPFSTHYFHLAVERLKNVFNRFDEKGIILDHSTNPEIKVVGFHIIVFDIKKDNGEVVTCFTSLSEDQEIVELINNNARAPQGQPFLVGVNSDSRYTHKVFYDDTGTLRKTVERNQKGERAMIVDDETYPSEFFKFRNTNNPKTSASGIACQNEQHQYAAPNGLTYISDCYAPKNETLSPLSVSIIGPDNERRRQIYHNKKGQAVFVYLKDEQGSKSSYLVNPVTELPMINDRGTIFFSNGIQLSSFSKEKKGNPKLTSKDYIRKIAGNVKHPLEWEALRAVASHAKVAASKKVVHFSVLSPEEYVENDMKGRHANFSFFAQRILEEQGIKSQVVNMMAAGIMTVWIQTKTGKNFDFHYVNAHMYGKNGHIYSFLGGYEPIDKDYKKRTDILTALRSMEPVGINYPDFVEKSREAMKGFNSFQELLTNGFVAMKNMGFSINENLTRAALQLWWSFDGMIPVLDRLPDGRVITREVSTNTIIN